MITAAIVLGIIIGVPAAAFVSLVVLGAVRISGRLSEQERGEWTKR